MDMIQIPEAVCAQPGIQAGPLRFLSYRDQGGHFRNRVLFNCYAFSFVQNGEKHIFRDGGQTLLRAGQGMLIPTGHSLIAEHSNNTDPYHSILIFFPHDLGHDFVRKQLGVQKAHTTAVPFLHFESDEYLNSYIGQLKMLIESGMPLSGAMAIHKLHELLLYLGERFPAQLAGLFDDGRNTSLQQLVEQHLFSKLTLEEMAFLAHRSLASFKRDFEKLYGIAPQRYIRQRKLELAAAELAQGKNAADLYLDYGYENLSNFCTAFRRKYGKAPGSWQHELSAP
ncbi:helix-turn-helix transcriptional regulator [Mucilaginibacter lacusdianchii]|uniref:helix-turn-helix transcriptional regulator n=1 Tax=Mucilaginibacter lacusdianchii TaxID=2684211 RepID=UPI00131B9D2F|nr:AraC family transcriptional regulator [Mucilaginibacter sp. JXJ CY 39]